MQLRQIHGFADMVLGMVVGGQLEFEVGDGGGGGGGGGLRSAAIGSLGFESLSFS